MKSRIQLLCLALGALAVAGCDRRVDVQARNRLPFAVHVVSVYKGLDGKPAEITLGEVPAGAVKRFAGALIPAQSYRLWFTSPAGALVDEATATNREAGRRWRVTAGPLGLAGTWREDGGNATTLDLLPDGRFRLRFLAGRYRVSTDGRYTAAGNTLTFVLKHLWRNGRPWPMPASHRIVRQYSINQETLTLDAEKYHMSTVLRRSR